MVKNLLTQINEGYTIRVAKTLGEVEEIREIWKAMQWHPETDIDWFRAEVEMGNEILRPHVMVLYKDEIAQAILLGKIEMTTLEIKFGYKRLFNPRVRSLTILYGGILGDPSPDCSAMFIGALMDVLSRREADFVFFNYLRVDSPIYHLATTQPRFFSRNWIKGKNLHWRLVLPDSFEEFLQSLSKNEKSNFRKISKRLGKKYGEALAIRCFSKKADIDIILRDMEEIESKTYHRGLGVGFVNDLRIRRRYELAAERQWLRAYILYLERKPVAFYSGCCGGNTLFWEYTGFDPSYYYYKPGFYLQMKIIEELCRNKDISVLDFGLGDARHKRIFCKECHLEGPVYIFAPTLRGLTLNAFWSAVAGLDQMAKRMVTGLNLMRPIKKKWRQHVAAKIKTTGENG